MSIGFGDEFLTVAEIAQRLKLNAQTVRNWIDQGTLPAVRIGRRVRVRRIDLEALLDQGRTRPAVTEPALPANANDDEALATALARAERLLTRRSPAPRRAEFASGLEDLARAVAARLASVEEPSQR